MTENNRLLDKGEITGAIMEEGQRSGITYSPRYFTENIRQFKIVAKAQAKLTREETLKAVFKILEDYGAGNSAGLPWLEFEKKYGTGSNYTKSLLPKLKKALKTKYGGER